MRSTIAAWSQGERGKGIAQDAAKENREGSNKKAPLSGKSACKKKTLAAKSFGRTPFCHRFEGRGYRQIFDDPVLFVKLGLVWGFAGKIMFCSVFLF